MSEHLGLQTTSTALPFCITTTSSAISETTPKSCVMNSTAVFLRCCNSYQAKDLRLRHQHISAVVGSSAINGSGSGNNAMAITTGSVGRPTNETDSTAAAVPAREDGHRQAQTGCGSVSHALLEVGCASIQFFQLVADPHYRVLPASSVPGAPCRSGCPRNRRISFRSVSARSSPKKQISPPTGATCSTGNRPR